MIRKILCLSTGHLPYPDTAEEICFTRICVLNHGNHGFALFVTEPDDEDIDIESLDWLQPIMKAAWEDGCMMILFDCDEDIDPRFETFDWEVSNA